MSQHRHFRWLLLVLVSLMSTMALAASMGARAPYTNEGVYTSAKDIEKAQAILVEDGGLAAGSFKAREVDPPTAQALRSFQWQHGLRQTGLVDYETMALLESHSEPGDADGDFVADALDRCPDTPKGANVDGQGCPKDADGDGVPDGIDACFGTPTGANVDSRGCPSDSDGDKVADGIDQCPDTPRGAVVDARGCPIDSDGDGISDGLDLCADTPAGTKVDSRGCTLPAKSADMFQESSKLVLEGVSFETNSAKLTPDSLRVLDRVVFSLRDHSDVRAEIGGYTDSKGDEGHNSELSQARADSVRDYLVSQGVDSSRLVSKGYGESDPIADNKTAQGRAKNRRVELSKLE